MKLIKLLALIAITLSATACETMVSQIAKPTPYGLYSGMNGKSPDGTPSFKQGWEAGCESGISAYGSLHHKSTHDFKYDANKLHDNEYHAAWTIGFRHCRWYSSEWERN